MVKRILHTVLFSTLFLLAGFSGFGQSGNPNTVGCNIYIPNAFTPNGDDINERFVVGLSDNCKLLEYEMRVFDRWGRLVYETETSDPMQAWDGTTEGKEAQKGVYMWNVYAKVLPLNSGKEETESVSRHGTVVLIR